MPKKKEEKSEEKVEVALDNDTKKAIELEKGEYNIPQSQEKKDIAPLSRRVGDTKLLEKKDTNLKEGLSNDRNHPDALRGFPQNDLPHRERDYGKIYPSPAGNDRNKKIAIVILLGTILLVANLWLFLFWDAFSKNQSQINIDSPSIPITNNYQNSFPQNISIIVQLDEKILNKTISDAVESTLKKLNLTNSS